MTSCGAEEGDDHTASDMNPTSTSARSGAPNRFCNRVGSSKEMMGSAADTPRCEGRFATAHINDHTRPAEQSDPTWAYLCCTHVMRVGRKGQLQTPSFKVENFS